MYYTFIPDPWPHCTMCGAPIHNRRWDGPWVVVDIASHNLPVESHSCEHLAERAADVLNKAQEPAFGFRYTVAQKTP